MQISKPCIMAENKITRNGKYNIYKNDSVTRQIPKTDKPYHKMGQKIVLEGLVPGKTIFYFAAGKRDFTKSILSMDRAYSKLENNGVTKVNKNGKAIAYLKCPQLYVNYNGKVYPRHIHFLYWDKEDKKWEKDLYTQPVLCNVDKAFFKKYCKSAILICAESEKDFEKDHIEGSISLTYKKKWTSKEIIEKIKEIKPKYDGNKLVPIIIYCHKNHGEGECLYRKLDKLGFHNTMHYKW